MIEYPDTCIISRSEGMVDENGFEINTELYNGECLLEVTGQSRYNGFEFENEPVLFIPVNNIIFKINDIVNVTASSGRVISYTIKNWEAEYDDEFMELNDTCIWLKDGTEGLG